MKKILTAILLIAMAISQTSVATAIVDTAHKARIKDLVHVKGVRDNQVVGYGIVVGLQNTGDNSRHTQMTAQQMLMSLGTVIDQANYIQKGAAAAVIVTATIPPFAKNGDRVDVTVSAMADAKSLRGGVLVQTQLRAPNGEIVAVAQGPLSLGGGAGGAAGGSSTRSGVSTTARVPGGAIIERDIMTEIGDETSLTLLLDKADYTEASKIAKAISNAFTPARAIDGSAIEVAIPAKFLNNRIEFLSILENMEVTIPEDKAKIVINERTGTVVIGANVKLAPAAIAHGGITVTIKARNDVSQPNAFARGETARVTNAEIQVKEDKASLVEMKANSTLGELVGALNTIGVKPTDLIAILQALKSSGSLNADLEVI